MKEAKDYPVADGGFEVYRIISTRYPQIALFERVASADSFDILYEFESLTNPRLRDEVGDIQLVAKEDRVFGPGSSWIMAPFTHPPVEGNSGRFNRGFGMFYAGLDEDVAIAETKYHSARFLKESRVDSITTEMRLLKAMLGYKPLRDISKAKDKGLYHKTDYSAAQALGKAMRKQGDYGVLYRSVRGEGLCVGLFRPNAVAAIAHSRYLNYHYKDGKITSVTAAKVA